MQNMLAHYWRQVDWCFFMVIAQIEQNSVRVTYSGQFSFVERVVYLDFQILWLIIKLSTVADTLFCIRLTLILQDSL